VSRSRGGCGRGGAPGDPLECPDQPDVPDSVSQLRPPSRLEVREQVELACVVRLVVHAT
jgi:hypothetical protein